MSKKKKGYPGVYIIKLTKLVFGLRAGRIIYIGKGDDVKDRLNNELGIKSGPATFFRSIGLLLGKRVIPGSGKKGTGYNFRFYPEDRQEIVDWLRENTEQEVKKCDWRKQEEKLIRINKPPINIQYNNEHCPPELKGLRKKAHAIARK